jgi:hypothetical protein
LLPVMAAEVIPVTTAADAAEAKHSDNPAPSTMAK